MKINPIVIRENLFKNCRTYEEALEVFDEEIRKIEEHFRTSEINPHNQLMKETLEREVVKRFEWAKKYYAWPSSKFAKLVENIEIKLYTI